VAAGGRIRLASSADSGAFPTAADARLVLEESTGDRTVEQLSPTHGTQVERTLEAWVAGKQGNLPTDKPRKACAETIVKILHRLLTLPVQPISVWWVTDHQSPVDAQLGQVRRVARRQSDRVGEPGFPDVTMRGLDRPFLFVEPEDLLRRGSFLPRRVGPQIGQNAARFFAGKRPTLNRHAALQVGGSPPRDHCGLDEDGSRAT
jgi:hypothetical protein